MLTLHSSCRSELWFSQQEKWQAWIRFCGEQPSGTTSKNIHNTSPKNHFVYGTIFDKASLRLIAIAMITNLHSLDLSLKAIFGISSSTWMESRILKRREPIVNYEISHNCRLSIRYCCDNNEFSRRHPVHRHWLFQRPLRLVFDIASMQDATENYHYIELVGKPLRNELKLSFSIEDVAKSILLAERMYSVAVDKFGVVRKKTFKMDKISVRQIIDRIPTLEYQYIGYYPCDWVPNLRNITFVIIKTQPSKMQEELWIMSS